MAKTNGFKRALKKVTLTAQKAAFSATIKAAEDLAQTMRNVAPKDKGNLVESIRVKVDEANLRCFVKAGGKLTTVEVRKGSGVPYDYALAQEFGTESAVANPFFWPVWRLRKRGLKNRMTRAVNKAVKAEAQQQGLGK